MSAKPGWDDQKMEVFIGGLLREGVLLSAVTVLAGAIIYLARHGYSHVKYSAFQGEPAEYKTVGGVLRNVAALHGRGIIQLGLLILIATPVARVLFAIFGFLRERDTLYAVVAAIVLVILLCSLIFS
jgi:uncharacterized membrane protein